MKQRPFFLCVFILGAVFCLGSAHATLYWDDDFESALTGRWVYLNDACNGSPCTYVDRSTEHAHSGSHSLKLHYDLDLTLKPFDDSHSVAIVRSMPQTAPTLFTRFYYFTKAPFTYYPDHGGVKGLTTHFYQEDLGTGVVNLSGSRAMAMAVQTGQDCYFSGGLITDCYANWYAIPNIQTVDLTDNQWYCIETETTMNSPGSSNAVLRLWVDGVLTLEYKNFRLRGTSAIGANGNSSLSEFNTIQIYKQYGHGDAYFDDFAVGTTRIGCGGSADTTPPFPPKGLAIR